MDKCKFHPNKIAHVRCKTCHIPLCDDCKMVTDIGIFCSEDCYVKAKEFQERVKPDAPVKKNPSIIWLIVKLVILVALIALVALALDFLGIYTLPFVDVLKGLIGLG